jgi:N-acetylmuramoyl-L-alanine amidase
MNPLFSYLLQVIAASGLLYGFYHFVLRNNKFHHYNRFYLLISLLLAITIPFFNIPIYFSATDTDTSLLQQFSILVSSEISTEEPVIIQSHLNTWFSIENALYAFYFLIAFIAFLRIIFSLNKIRTIARNNPVEKLDNINFVTTEESSAPFSFFNWLFWNRKLELHSEKGEQIFRHELFHIQQKHSWDIIFFEIITVLFWINPFFHLMKKELKAIHEFLADAFAVKENKKWEYAELLLMQAFDTQINLVNPFFHNQIKRRIAMLNLSSKPGQQYLRKLLALPITALVIFLFAFSFRNGNSDNISVIASAKTLSLVIDAGHGGDDTGAKSPDGSYSEANLSLEISKTIQRLAPEYNINVTMTRENEDDPYVELKKRVEIINNTKPDAFVSIHLNTSSSKTENKLSGFEVFLKKDYNDQRDRLLATSVLLELSNVYASKMEIKQRATGIYVLTNVNVPAILLECGYINNPKDLAFITEKTNQEKVARSILKGIVAFANSKTQENK